MYVCRLDVISFRRASLLAIELSLLKAKFHYTSWFGASSELAPNMFGASSELASVMEFGFKVCAMTNGVSHPLVIKFGTYGSECWTEVSKLRRLNVRRINESIAILQVMAGCVDERL